jgi:hypothetical protein
MSQIPHCLIWQYVCPVCAVLKLCKHFEVEHNLNNPHTTILLSPPNSSAQMAPWVTQKFLAILSNLEESYKQSKRSDRKEMVKQAVSEIEASAEKDGVAIPPTLSLVCPQSPQQWTIDPQSLQESTCLVPEQSTKKKGSSSQEEKQTYSGWSFCLSLDSLQGCAGEDVR